MNGSDFTVSIENASVRYLTPVEPYWSFKEFIIRAIERRVQMKECWALRDVTFQIAHGETLGIIGRNGAGKSTLLKLIARVLAPTNGRIIINGAVAPMLELGAGFHFELTGRENIFLNGALLGHTQKEIKAHLPEILDFAQIDGFVDSPLRTYSSGMIARLGFAVATSWEPEILLLDEVMAVGDEEFRARCYARMKTFRENGATTLFVSHDLNAVLSECERAVWLDQGRVMQVGSADVVIAAYRAAML